MKIIEAMKRIKLNNEKIGDLQNKIASNSAHLTHETPAYGQEQKWTVDGWVQSALDLTQENARLQLAIQRTNLNIQVTILIDDHTVTKVIAEWVLRRRLYAAIDLATVMKLTDRNLREGRMESSTGVPIDVKIIRYYDPADRDRRLNIYRSEPHLIDAALEIVNATTDLIEA